MTTLPRPVVYYDYALVPHPAVILDAQEKPSAPAHIVVRLSAGPTGEVEMWGVEPCDPATPTAGCWSEIP